MGKELGVDAESKHVQIVGFYELNPSDYKLSENLCFRVQYYKG